MKKQAKTAAQRQKAYRERRAQQVGEERINTWVSARAHEVLASMAVRYGVTQKVMLERLILKADDGLVVAASRARGGVPQGSLRRPPAVTPSQAPAQSALWDEPLVIAQPKTAKGNKAGAAAAAPAARDRKTTRG